LLNELQSSAKKRFSDIGQGSVVLEPPFVDRLFLIS